MWLAYAALMVYMASIVGRSTRSMGFQAGCVVSPGGRCVMPVSIASRGLSDETDQSLPPETTAPDRTTLAIGYSHRERCGPSAGSVSLVRYSSPLAQSAWKLATTPRCR